ncbi:hypothetical protein F2Q70_00035583 [Brassica cretica]|uniref:Uncharacterized protein n=1 Tax=Brassica cretica TaxID=69181 RepID=A0A8S9JXR1_BRACR|nr:hypothetical protein F2Q70_00035583 [Brassica cretica]
MNSNRKSPVSGDLTARKPNGKDVVSSAEPVKRDGQTGVSIATDVSGDPKKTKPNGKAVVSSTEPIRRTEQTGGSCANAVSGDLIPKKSNGKAVVSSAGTIKHSSGSGVPSAKTDEVLFFKDVKFGPQEGELSPVQFPEDRFRFYGYEEFEAVSDLKGDLYYYVGHMKLVNEQTLNDSLVMNGHVMKLYLWDKAATDLCEKFKAHENTPSVIMVTTVNPKRFGGALALSSLSSSRVFFDMDVQPTRDYLTYSKSDVANMVNAEIVTTAEIVTIGELFSYIKQEGAKVAWFECTATIDDVDVVSSAEPVKRDGQTGVSIATDVSGDPKKTKPNGKAVVSSTEPIRRTRQTGGSCANAVSGDLIPKKSNGKAVVSSAGTIKHSGGSGVPSAKTDEVLFFKDVMFGPQEDSPVQFPVDRFRFYGYEEFEAASDLKRDLYYYVGQMKLVNEQTLNDSLVMNGHVMKLYLWDKAATDLCQKFKAHGNTPSVIMVTTVNPKRFGGALALSSLSSSRVFFDMDVQPTRDYLT